MRTTGIGLAVGALLALAAVAAAAPLLDAVGLVGGGEALRAVVPAALGVAAFGLTRARRQSPRVERSSSSARSVGRAAGAAEPRF